MCELAQAQTKLTSDQNLDILKALMEVSPDSMEALKTSTCMACCMTVEFGKMCQETDIRIAEVKRDAYEFRPGIE